MHPDSITEVAPDREELRRTVRAALRILKKPTAIMRTEASWIMTAALEKITARGTCCLECALLVPYWVQHGSDHAMKDGEILGGMNQRKNLTYLWGDAWGNLMGDATSYYREERAEGIGDGADFDALLDDLGSTARTALYRERDFPDDDEGDAAGEAYYQARREACAWCPKQKRR